MRIASIATQPATRSPSGSCRCATAGFCRVVVDAIPTAPALRLHLEHLVYSDLVSNRGSFAVANADTGALRAFDEDTRVKECLGCTLLGTKMRDIRLICRRISRVNQWKLFNGHACQKMGSESVTSNEGLRTDLEQTEVEVSLSVRTFDGALVVLDLRDRFEWTRILRVEHLERELVPVDGDGKVVPRFFVERRLEQHGAVVRADAEHTRIGVRHRRIEWGPWYE